MAEHGPAGWGQTMGTLWAGLLHCLLNHGLNALQEVAEFGLQHATLRRGHYSGGASFRGVCLRMRLCPHSMATARAGRTAELTVPFPSPAARPQSHLSTDAHVSGRMPSSVICCTPGKQAAHR